jgi:hypothetical protein
MDRFHILTRIGSGDHNRARSTQLRQGFPQSSGRKQRVKTCGIGGIQQHKIDITMKRPMLKAIIQNDAVDWIPIQHPSPKRGPIGSHRDNGVGATLCHEKRLVPRF